ncbi:glutamate receptor 3.3 [Gossypium australe]|uniref:Glutamate receptor 3.3 n=1 Tax=Gossypium australe TaxID=47621 RepID=A0A5B6XBL7_9ROSI|nr:glutamate receptor 3.3 [Gossypium australe]
MQAAMLESMAQDKPHHKNLMLIMIGVSATGDSGMETRGNRFDVDGTEGIVIVNMLKEGRYRQESFGSIFIRPKSADSALISSCICVCNVFPFHSQFSSLTVGSLLPLRQI